MFLWIFNRYMLIPLQELSHFKSIKEVNNRDISGILLNGIFLDWRGKRKLEPSNICVLLWIIRDKSWCFILYQGNIKTKTSSVKPYVLLIGQISQIISSKSSARNVLVVSLFELVLESWWSLPPQIGILLTQWVACVLWQIDWQCLTNWNFGWQIKQNCVISSTDLRNKIRK